MCKINLFFFNSLILKVRQNYTKRHNKLISYKLLNNKTGKGNENLTTRSSSLNYKSIKKCKSIEGFCILTQKMNRVKRKTFFGNFFKKIKFYFKFEFEFK